ncbi:MAG: HisA/HisF-related TIM barrel protein [Bacillota bacterium]
MIIIPAMDLYQGMCVRLKARQLDKMTVFHENPVMLAKEWESYGVSRIHVSDLEGEFSGSPAQFKLIGEIVRAVRTPVEISGGMRDLAAAEDYLRSGARWVVVNSRDVRDLEALEEFNKRYPGRILIGVEAEDGKNAVSGWAGDSPWNAVDMVSTLKRKGAVGGVVITDVDHDGAPRGPNIEALSRMARLTGVPLVAAGAINTYHDLEQIKKLDKIGVIGAIVETALYDGNIDVAEAIRCFEE